MALNEKFRKITLGGGEPSVTYDYYDTLRLVGYLTFYPCKDRFKAGDTQYFTTTDIYTNGKYTSGARQTNVSSMAYVELLNQNFNLKFGTSQNLYGNMLFNIPVGIATESGIGPVGLKCSISTFISGANLTSVASGSYISSGATVTALKANAYPVIMAIDIPSVHIKANEYLRTNIKIEAIEESSQFENVWGAIMHNPRNISLSEANSVYIYPEGNFTQLKQMIPFKIDI